MNERAIPPLGKLTVIFDGVSSLEFEGVTETFATALERQYAGRRPFWIKHGTKRLLQFPKNPPKGVVWEEADK